MEEIWRDIINYEGLYKISNYGNVKSLNYLRTRKEQILQPGKNKGGYLYVNLHKNGVVKNYRVHRLVLEAFVGPCPPGMEGCHNNGNSSNNFVGNLRWDTRRNNQKDRKFHGTINNPAWIDNTGSKHGMSKLNDKQIIEIRGSKLKNKELSIKYNVSTAHVSRIKNKKRWKHI